MKRRRRVPLHVPLHPGDDATIRARAALRSRAARIEVDALPLHEDAATFWSERAWSELAAVPAMSQQAIALLRSPDIAGDLDVLGAVMQMGVDEVRHTELSRTIAEGLGGYVDVIPPGASWEPARLGDPSSMPLPFWVVASGCISETLSLALMRARLRHTTHRGVHKAISAVVQDEAVHQRIGWSLAERVLPTLSSSKKKEVAEHAEACFSIMHVTFATDGLPPRLRGHARRIRTTTAQAGLGACPPDEADAVVANTIVDVRARLRALGLLLR